VESELGHASLGAMGIDFEDKELVRACTSGCVRACARALVCVAQFRPRACVR
jgi:hypothetical protein